MSEHYTVSLAGDTASGIPSQELIFGRVNLFLGANGTGKSRLIRYQLLTSHTTDFGGERPLVFVEGGRVVQPPPSVALTKHNFGQFQNLREAGDRHRNQKSRELAGRVMETFLLLDQYGERTKATHSDGVIRWIDSGKRGEPPGRDEPPLDHLFRRFNQIFPEIHISVEPDTKKVVCRRGESDYQPANLSDGERQVLAILADLTILGDPHSLVLVDEPELNLHPQLACQLWDSIEASLPEAVFVYGTHCLGFALRSNVDTIHVLSGGGRPIVAVPDVTSIPEEKVREFIGAIPAILASPHALVVEGHDSSFDMVFYRWLMNRDDIAVVPVGSSHNVTAAANHTGVWDRLAPAVHVVGVVDRDFGQREAKTISGIVSDSRPA